VDKLQEVQDKLLKWYSSSATKFPDGTKMRLVPTFTSLNSMNNKTKFASCLARQAALTAGLASAVTREISNNLLLDRKDPITKKSFRQILMEIVPENKPGATLFHTINRQFKSEAIVNFQFHPENASEANNLIAGLVPFLRDSGHSFHLKMFTPEALQRHAKAKWNPETREADSETDAELANLLAEDDDLNFTNEPTLEKAIKLHDQTTKNTSVTSNIPSFPKEHMPSMHNEDDSVSTFHHGNTVNLTSDQVSEEDSDDLVEEEKTNSTTPSKSPVGILRTPRTQDQDVLSRISMSDSASRISSLETEISAMNKTFHNEINKLQSQAKQQANAQVTHGTMLSEILEMLKKANLYTTANAPCSPVETSHTTTPSNKANHLETVDAGGSFGAAGHG
jgi:hypothetical protein